MRRIKRKKNPIQRKKNEITKTPIIKTNVGVDLMALATADTKVGSGLKHWVLK